MLIKLKVCNQHTQRRGLNFQCLAAVQLYCSKLQPTKPVRMLKKLHKIKGTSKVRNPNNSITNSALNHYRAHTKSCLSDQLKDENIQKKTLFSPVSLTILAFRSTFFSTSLGSIPLDCNTSSRGLAAPKMEELEVLVCVGAA